MMEYSGLECFRRCGTVPSGLIKGKMDGKMYANILRIWRCFGQCGISSIKLNMLKDNGLPY